MTDAAAGRSCLVPIGAPAEMGNLDHHRRAVRVAIIDEFLEPGHDLVLIGIEIAERRGAVFGNDRRARRHRQRDPAFRLFRVIEPITFLRHAVFGIGRFVRRGHDPVA